MVREELSSSSEPLSTVYVRGRRDPALMDSSPKRELAKPALCEETGNLGGIA